jgi:hypothetical protein
MASAIPAAIGVGTSLIGGISGKGAAKHQRELAEKQLKQLQPLIDAQIAGSQFGLNTAKQLYPQAISNIQNVYNKATGAYDPLFKDYQSLLSDALGTSKELDNSGRTLTQGGAGILGGSLPYLSGAANTLGELQKFYRPFMNDGQRAIDRFLPGNKQVQDLFATEFGNVNQGYRSASENIARFAPRGGGRVSSLARADIDRQKQLSDVYSQGKQSLLQLNLQNAFQGAQGQQGIANALAQLGLGQGQLGLGTIGQGLNTIGTGTSRLGTEGGLAHNSLSQALQALGIGGQSAGNLGQLASGLFGEGLSGGQGAYNLYNAQANRSFASQPTGEGGKGLGGFLVDLFGNKGVQDKIGGLFGGSRNTQATTSTSLPNIDFFGQG